MEELDHENLTEKLNESESKARTYYKDEEDSEEDEEEINLTDEAKDKKKKFKENRKHHYNEFENVKRARELIAKEMAELEEDGKMDMSK